MSPTITNGFASDSLAVIFITESSNTFYCCFFVLFIEPFALFSNMDDRSDSDKSKPPGDMKIFFFVCYNVNAAVM